MTASTPITLVEAIAPVRRVRRHAPRLIAGFALLLGLTLSVYYPALHARRVADDFMLVGQVTFSDALSYFHKTFGFGRNEYRPLTALSYAVDRALWNSNPEGYHLTNLVLHAAAAGLLLLFLESLAADTPLALLAGCLFVILPINAYQRVPWISARDGNICAVFLLGALWLFVLSRRQHRKIWHAIAIALAACALLSYEGAVIVPALVFLVEFVFFAPGTLRVRLASSFRRTVWFWILTAAYLCLWVVMFSGKTGAYSLSTTSSAIFHNYVYLISALFCTRKMWLFMVICVIMLALFYKMRQSLRRLVIFSTLLILIAFLPYCFTRGFASRFGYISALGMAILVSVLIVAGMRRARHAQQAAIACLATLMCLYYIVEDRKILSAWKAAGQIAARIPRAAHDLYPSPHAGAVLVFAGVPAIMPAVHGQVPIFQTGLADAIQQEYAVHIFVRQYSLPLAGIPKQAERGAVIFEYVGGENPLREISSPVPLSHKVSDWETPLAANELSAAIH